MVVDEVHAGWLAGDDYQWAADQKQMPQCDGSRRDPAETDRVVAGTDPLLGLPRSRREDGDPPGVSR